MMKFFISSILSAIFFSTLALAFDCKGDPNCDLKPDGSFVRYTKEKDEKQNPTECEYCKSSPVRLGDNTLVQTGSGGNLVSPDYSSGTDNKNNGN